MKMLRELVLRKIQNDCHTQVDGILCLVTPKINLNLSFFEYRPTQQICSLFYVVGMFH